MPVAKYWDGSQWVPTAVGPTGGSSYSQPIGDGASLSFSVVHGFGTRNVSVSCYLTAAPYNEVTVDVERTDANTVTVRTEGPPIATGAYTVVVAAAGAAAGNATYSVSGRITGATGAVQAGTGFTVSRASAGNYVVTLTGSHFPVAPIATVSPYDPTGLHLLSRIYAHGANSFSVVFETSAGVATDPSAFNFAAVAA